METMIEFTLTQFQPIPSTDADIIALLPPSSQHDVPPPQRFDQRLRLNVVGVQPTEGETRATFEVAIVPHATAPHAGLTLNLDGQFADFVAVRTSTGLAWRLLGGQFANTYEV